MFLTRFDQDFTPLSHEFIYHFSGSLQIIHQMSEQLKQFVLQVFVRVRMLWFLRLLLEALVAKMVTESFLCVTVCKD